MDSLTFSASDQGAIDALINRKNVITIPSYLLRWIPYAGVHQVILRVALEQLFYLHQLQESDGEVKTDLSRYCQAHAVQTRYVDIARWCAMSQRTIIRHLEESPLFEKSNQGCEVVDDHYQQKANRYDLPPLRLTPGDAEDLLQYIARSKEEGASLPQLLEALDKLALSDIASEKPYRTPGKTDRFKDRTPTLRDLLFQVYGPLPKELLGKVEKLQFDLINPLDSYLTIPWYWFRELLPIVGHHEMAAYLMCLPLTYRDRTTFNLTGGAKRIARWVGRSTLALAFPRGNGINSRKSAAARKLAQKRAQLALLFQPQENKKGKKNTYTIGLKRNPLLPHHQAALYTLFSTPGDGLAVLARALEVLEKGHPLDAHGLKTVYVLLGRIFDALENEKDLAFDNLNLEKCLAFDDLNYQNVLAFVNLRRKKDLANDNLNPEKALASDNPGDEKHVAFDNLNPEKGLAPDKLLKILKIFKIPQILHQMPAFQDSPPTSGEALEGRETTQNTLLEMLIGLLDQPIPKNCRGDTAAWILEGYLQSAVHDPPGYAHFKAIQKQRPGPEHLRPLLACPLDLVLTCLADRTTFDMSYYSRDDRQNAVYGALRAYDWEALQRLREGLEGFAGGAQEGPRLRGGGQEDGGEQPPVSFWAAFREHLQEIIPRHDYQTWFSGGLRLVQVEEGVYGLVCNNSGVVHAAEKHRAAFESALARFAPDWQTLHIREG